MQQDQERERLFAEHAMGAVVGTASALRHVADECYAALRQTLENDVQAEVSLNGGHSAVQEIKTEAQGRIAEVKARIEDLVQQEVRRSFWSAVESGGNEGARDQFLGGIAGVTESVQATKEYLKDRLKGLIEKEVSHVRETVQQEVLRAFEETLKQAADLDAGALADQVCKIQLDQVLARAGYPEDPPSNGREVSHVGEWDGSAETSGNAGASPQEIPAAN